MEDGRQQHKLRLAAAADPGRRARAAGGVRPFPGVIAQRARIRLLRALCSTSASPSTSSTGGM
jgi:hypothetical protein